MASPQWVVGNDVVLRTAGGEEVTGQLYAHDVDCGLLLIKEMGLHNGVANLRFLKSSHVAELVKNVPPKVSLGQEPFSLLSARTRPC